MLSVGAGNGITMWLTAMYLIADADRLAHEAVTASTRWRGHSAGSGATGLRRTDS
jgi:hypothetical protein